MTYTLTDEDIERADEVFDYLEELRESGETNMFGATTYIQSEFGFEQVVARAWLSHWMTQY